MCHSVLLEGFLIFLPLVEWKHKKILPLSVGISKSFVQVQPSRALYCVSECVPRVIFDFLLLVEGQYKKNIAVVRWNFEIFCSSPAE